MIQFSSSVIFNRTLDATPPHCCGLTCLKLIFIRMHFAIWASWTCKHIIEDTRSPTHMYEQRAEATNMSLLNKWSFRKCFLMLFQIQSPDTIAGSCSTDLLRGGRIKTWAQVTDKAAEAVMQRFLGGGGISSKRWIGPSVSRGLWKSSIMRNFHFCCL